MYPLLEGKDNIDNKVRNMIDWLNRNNKIKNIGTKKEPIWNTGDEKTE